MNLVLSNALTATPVYPLGLESRSRRHEPDACWLTDSE